PRGSDLGHRSTTGRPSAPPSTSGTARRSYGPVPSGRGRAPRGGRRLPQWQLPLPKTLPAACRSSTWTDPTVPTGESRSVGLSPVQRTSVTYRPRRAVLVKRQVFKLCYNRRMMQAVVVTGASSGIGRAAAIRFAREGAGVLAVGRQRAVLDEIAGEIREAGG